MSALSGDGRPVLQVLEGGVSNSRLSDTSVASATSGFDTVRFRFRRQEGAYHQAKAHSSALHARGERVIGSGLELDSEVIQLSAFRSEDGGAGAHSVGSLV